MKRKFLLRNYYFTETMLKEIDKFNVISFSIFDNIILRTVFSEQDIFKLAVNNTGTGINETEFITVRESAEMELNSSGASASIDSIYSEIQKMRPSWDTQALKSAEISAWLECVCVNPLMKPVYDKAVLSGKEVILAEDCCLTHTIMDSILTKCGLCGYSRLYVSSEICETKASGGLFRKMLEDTKSNAEAWLHISGSNAGDCVMAREEGMTAAYYKSPLTMYLEEVSDLRERSASDNETENLTAPEVNQIYTQKQEPSDEEVIKLEDVSIMFNMSSERIDNIKEYIIRLVKRELNFKEFWALKNVSFTIRRGEKIGIIGTNGSGKSTILKIVSGVMQCTKGNVTVNGTIAPMIELGAGFDMELSARENVYLNGAILGYSKADMESRYNDIISFAELEEFQDIAIKNYSSGMVARLGFAIATSHVPDILIIDEILSVGDFSFQNKCRERIKELTENGATVLLVSHSADDIINMCDRAIWLDKGVMCADGEAQYTVEKYINSLNKKGDCRS